MTVGVISFGLVMMFLTFLFVALGIGLFIFWIVMLIDCAKRKFKLENDKIMWILIIIFLGWLGAIIYYFVVKRK